MTTICILPPCPNPSNTRTHRTSRFQLVAIRGMHIPPSVPTSNSESCLDVGRATLPLHLSFDLSLPNRVTLNHVVSALRISRQVHLVPSPVSLLSLSLSLSLSLVLSYLFRILSLLHQVCRPEAFRVDLARPFLLPLSPLHPIIPHLPFIQVISSNALVFSPHPIINNVFPS